MRRCQRREPAVWKAKKDDVRVIDAESFQSENRFLPADLSFADERVGHRSDLSSENGRGETVGVAVGENGNADGASGLVRRGEIAPGRDGFVICVSDDEQYTIRGFR